MAGTQAPTRAEFVAAAITFVDQHGLGSLTLRSLGDTLGVTHTALYRHFRDKDELLLAMIDSILGEITRSESPAGASPRERLLHRLRFTREVLGRHPEITAAIVSTPGTVPRAREFTLSVVEQLEAMGLRGADVPECYQVLEDYVLGATIYDHAGSPEHLESRRVRHRLLGHPLFDDISRTTAGIAAHNEAAFERGLTMLVDGCAARA